MSNVRMIAALTLFATAFASAADYDVYTDSLQNGWQDWSFVTRDLNATPAHGGTASIKASTATANYEGLYFHQDGFDTTPYSSISFWAYMTASGTQQLQFRGRNGANIGPVIVLPDLQASSWTLVAIAMIDAGFPDQLMDGFTIQDNRGQAGVDFWIDEIKFVAKTGGGTPDRVIYDEALAAGWSQYSWAQVDFASTAQAHGGTKSVAITFQNAGAGMYIHRDTSKIDTSLYQSLSVWLHGGSAGGQKVRIKPRLNDSPLAGYALTPLVANTWTHFDIQLVDLGMADKTNFDGLEFVDNNNSAQPAFYLDDLTLISKAPSNKVARPTISPNGGSFTTPQQVTITCATNNAAIRYTTNGSTPSSTAGTLYAGAFTVNATSTVKAIAYLAGMDDSDIASATFTINAGGGGGSGLDIYTDSLQSGWENWSWNGTYDFNSPSPVHGGTKAISATIDTDGALYLHHAPMDTSGYKELSFWFNPGASGQQLVAKARLNGVDQPPVGILPIYPPNFFSHVTISLTELGAENKSDLDGIIIQNVKGAPIPVFYIDDVTFTPAPVPNPIRLQIDANTTIRTLPAGIHGINTAVYDNNLSNAATNTFLTNGGISILRFPGGSLSDEFDWSTNKSLKTSNSYGAVNFATFAKLAEAVGAEACVTCNYGSGTPEMAAAWVAYANADVGDQTAIGTDTRGTDWKKATHWASLRAAAPLGVDDGFNFLRISHPAPFNIKHWEIGNEVWGGYPGFPTHWEYDQHGIDAALPGAAGDAVTYAAYFKMFQVSMKKVDPTIRVGAVALAGQDDFENGHAAVTNPNDSSTHKGWSPVMLAQFKAVGAQPDFLAYHRYPNAPFTESDAGTLGVSSGWKTDAANLRKLLTDYFTPGGTNVQLYATEQNIVYAQPGKQTVSLVGGLFYADSLAQVSKTEFAATMWFNLRNGQQSDGNLDNSLYGTRNYGDYGIIAPDNTPYPTYYGAKLLTHWARGGDQIVTATTNYNLLSVYAAKLANQKLALLVINKNPTTDLTSSVEIAGFTPQTAATIFKYGKPEDLANADISQSSINNASATFNYTFPSYSMTVLLLSPTGPQQLAAPMINPNGGTFSAPVQVTLTATNGANIRYTTDGSAPSSTVGTVYSAPFTLNSSCTVKAIAYKTTFLDSDIASAAFTINIVAQPTIDTVNPSSGSTAGGDSVTITGTNLENASAVDFGGAPATINTKSTTSITVTTGAHSAALVAVAVTTPGGTATKSNAFTYVGPTVDSIAPNTGASTGAEFVVINGTRLTGATDVTFDGLSATISLHSDTQMTVITPPHANGVVDVVVFFPAETVTKAGAFTYVGPVVASVSPNSGLTSGGETVVISGENLTDATSVTFGGTPAASFQINGSDIEAVTPAHSVGAVTLTVTTPNGTADAAFTFVPPAPQITSIDPAFGPATVAQQVTLTGTNFELASVNFDGIVGIISSNTGTQIVVTAPAHAAGVVQVTVTTPGGSAQVSYQYIAAPTVSSITPNKGPATGGQQVTITGTGFAAGATVSFGTTPATNVSIESTTSITATTPAHASGVVSVVVQNLDAQKGTLVNGYTYNSPPTIPSTPVVSPAVPYTHRPVSVTVAPVDVDGDTMTLSFDWGDGASGAENTHTFNTAGAYTVTITVSDGINAPISQTITITVTDPKPLPVSKVAGSFSLTASGKDSAQLSATLPAIPAGYSFDKKILKVDIAGAAVSLTLDAKGKGKTAAGTVALKVKLGKTGFAGGDVPLAAKFKGTFANIWRTTLGFDPNTSVKNATVSVLVDCTLDGALYSSTQAASLTVSARKSGKFQKQK